MVEEQHAGIFDLGAIYNARICEAAMRAAQFRGGIIGLIGAKPRSPSPK
jgi:hypothetical protein